MKIFNMVVLAGCALLVACGGGGGAAADKQASSATVLEKKIELYGDSTQWGQEPASPDVRVAHPPSDYVTAPGYTVVNLGISATMTSDLIGGHAPLLRWAEQVKQSTASVVVVNYGLNDSVFLTADQFTANLRQIAIAAKAAGKIVAFETPNPSTRPNVAQFAQLTRLVAQELDIHTIDVHAYLEAAIGTNPITDFMPDGIHPSQSTYTLIGTFLNNELSKFVY